MIARIQTHFLFRKGLKDRHSGGCSPSYSSSPAWLYLWLNQLDPNYLTAYHEGTCKTPNPDSNVCKHQVYVVKCRTKPFHLNMYSKQPFHMDIQNPGPKWTWVLGHWAALRYFQKELEEISSRAWTHQAPDDAGRCIRLPHSWCEPLLGRVSKALNGYGEALEIKVYIYIVHFIPKDPKSHCTHIT